MARLREQIETHITLISGRCWESRLAAYTLEQLQNAIAEMLQGGTHTNLTITYDGVSGTINLSALGGGGLDQDQAEDIVAALVGDTAGEINVAYDDAAGTLTFSLSGNRKPPPRRIGSRGSRNQPQQTRQMPT